MAICAGSFRPTPALTTNAEHICPWTKIRRTLGRSNGSASLLLSRSLADFIISIVGSSFWQAHRPRRPWTSLLLDVVEQHRRRLKHSDKVVAPGRRSRELGERQVEHLLVCPGLDFRRELLALGKVESLGELQPQLLSRGIGRPTPCGGRRPGRHQERIAERVALIGHGIGGVGNVPAALAPRLSVEPAS